MYSTRTSPSTYGHHARKGNPSDRDMKIVAFHNKLVQRRRQALSLPVGVEALELELDERSLICRLVDRSSMIYSTRREPVPACVYCRVCASSAFRDRGCRTERRYEHGWVRTIAETRTHVNMPTTRDQRILSSSLATSSPDSRETTRI